MFIDLKKEDNNFSIYRRIKKKNILTGELFHQCATRTDEVKLMNSPEFSCVSIDPPKFYTFLLLI